VRVSAIGVSPGLASGRAILLDRRETAVFRVPIPEGDLAIEIARLTEAREVARGQILALKDRVAAVVGETFAGVFGAHLLILDDPLLISGTEEIIRTERVNAEWALKLVAEKLLEAFQRIGDDYLRERGGDLEDVHNRLQGLLAGERHRHELSELTEDSVVVARSLSPSDAALLDHERVVAFCTDVGGRTSHIAILASALQIPAVVGTHDLSARVATGDLLLVDGNRGLVLVRPSETELASYRQACIEFAQHERELQEESNLPATTLDGQDVTLMANIEFPEELDVALRHGAKGIGLYRSEFLFLSRSPALPTEEDHYAVYTDLVRRVAPEETIIRTLDLGGDKYFHQVLARNESNPVMGLRAIRFCLRRPEIFRPQLRGLLRASAEGNLKIMFPLVSGVGELRQARQVLTECRLELEAEGHRVASDLKVGIMVEVPSAALTADHLAREADFFSIGTNDLLQYCLALDRGNESLAGLYQPFHPALLRLLDGVVRAARRAGIEVSLCGELGADPGALPVLLGLGLRRLSMAPASIPEIRSAVRHIEAARAERMVADLLEMATAEEIEARVRAEFPPPGASPRPYYPGLPEAIEAP
jgi:phosphotransferase system enzyme I (PtsI)